MQVPFKVVRGGYEYSDALYYPDGNVPSAAQVEADAQARFDNWLAVITAPPYNDDETPVEEQIAEIVDNVLGEL